MVYLVDLVLCSWATDTPPKKCAAFRSQVWTIWRHRSLADSSSQISASLQLVVWIGGWVVKG